MSGQLSILEETNYQESTLSLLEVLAKTLVRLELAGVSKETEAVLSLKQYGLSENADQEFLFGKMLKEHSPQTLGQTLRQSSKPLLTLGAIDLNGNCLIQRSFYHRTGNVSTLLDILQNPQEVSKEYFLSESQVKSLTSGFQKSHLHYSPLVTAEETTEE